jgi:hypothetical protein
MLPSVLAAHAWGQLSVIFELEQDNLGDWHNHDSVTLRRRLPLISTINDVHKYDVMENNYVPMCNLLTQR